MRVAEAMRRQYQTVGSSESVQAAAQTLAEGDDHALLVLGEDERLIGVVTERDITVRAVADAKPAESTRVEEIMSSDLFTCGPEDDAAAIAGALRERQVDQAPVLDGGKLIGLLVLADLSKQPASDRKPGSGG